MHYHARSQRRVQRTERIGKIREKLDILKRPTWTTVSAKVIDVPREFACQLRRLELEQIERTLSDELDRLEEEEEEDDTDTWSDYGAESCTPLPSAKALTPPDGVTRINVSNQAPLLPRVVSVVDPLERDPSSSVFSPGTSSFLRKSDGPLYKHLPPISYDPMFREERDIAVWYKAIALETASLPPKTIYPCASASMTDLRKSNKPSSHSLPASIETFIKQELRKQRPIPKHVMTAQDFSRPQKEPDWVPRPRPPPPTLQPVCTIATDAAIVPRPVFSRRDSEPITSSSMGGQRLQRSLMSPKPLIPSVIRSF